jgi:DNA-binding NarL/FixJ family response regulator
LTEFARLAGRMPAGPKATDVLTACEREVLELVGHSASSKQIAARLGLVENTIKVHLCNIVDKVHVRNRTQLAALAVQEGVAQNTQDPLDDAAASGA